MDREDLFFYLYCALLAVHLIEVFGSTEGLPTTSWMSAFADRAYWFMPPVYLGLSISGSYGDGLLGKALWVLLAIFLVIVWDRRGQGDEMLARRARIAERKASRVAKRAAKKAEKVEVDQ